MNALDRFLQEHKNYEIAFNWTGNEYECTIQTIGTNDPVLIGKRPLICFEGTIPDAIEYMTALIGKAE